MASLTGEAAPGPRPAPSELGAALGGVPCSAAGPLLAVADFVAAFGEALSLPQVCGLQGLVSMLDDTSGVPPPKLAALHVRLLHLLLADEAASGWWPRDAQPRDEPRDRPGSGGAASAEGSSAVVGGADEEPQQRVLRGSQLVGWRISALMSQPTHSSPSLPEAEEEGEEEEPAEAPLASAEAAPVGAGGWAVEGLVGFRRRQEPGQAGREEWLVKWAGYSRGSSTWEPLDNLGDSLHAQAPPQPAVQRPSSSRTVACPAPSSTGAAAPA